MATLTRPAIFYAPHADDETLSMGVDIANHLHAGRDVVVVLMTAGASPAMLAVLNGDVPDTAVQYTHDPVLEGYADGRLTTGTAGAARVRELKSAVGSYRHFGGRVRRTTADVAGLGEGLSVEQARDVVLRYEASHPGASHKTMSWSDPHRDHSACGQALRQLRDQEAVTDARFYVQRGREQAARDAGLSPWEVVPAVGGCADAVRRAARAYAAWNPAAGSYGYGYRSVPDLFDAVVRDPRALAHR